MYSVKHNEETELFAVVNDETGEELNFFADREEAAAFIRVLKGEESLVDEPAEPATTTVSHEGDYGNEEVTQHSKAKETAISDVIVEVDVTAHKTKAESVREAIKQVKEQHGNMANVVEFAVKELEMSKQLARTYTKNNWDKVPG